MRSSVSSVAVACVVEGQGEIEALPILIRRLAEIIVPSVFVQVYRPIRIPRGRLIKAGELERAVDLAALRLGGDGVILVLIDADDDCPAQLGPRLLRRAQGRRGDMPISVVLAKSEFEAWFIAAARSLAGVRGLSANLVPPSDPEAIRGAKGWLGRQMAAGHNYSEVIDQPRLAAVFNLQQARNSPSFDKLWRDLERLLPEALQ